MSPTRNLLVWTENYWIGGCDRFLVDLLDGLRSRPVRVALAGNPHPEFDAWLSHRLPWLGPRHVVPVANLVQTPLHRLDRLRPPPPAAAPDRSVTATPRPASKPDPPGERIGVGAGAYRAALAGVRYGQASINHARLHRLMAAARPDALLINNGGYPGGESCRVAGPAARRAGVKRIVHFVHNMAHPPAWPAAAEDALDRRIDGAVDAWVTAAHRASDELARVRTIQRSRISTVHYGLPETVTAPLSTDRAAALRAEIGFDGPEAHLAVVANFEPRKGLGVLVGALGRLRADGVAIRAALVGDGPQRPVIEAEIAARGLGDVVRVLGWRDDVDAILQQADLLTLPSLANECLPYVILEAMDHGLPVVSTDVAGIPEMVLDGETGYVVAPGDDDALASALRRLIADPDTARRMGRQGHKRVRRAFTASRMTDEMSILLGL